MKKTAYIHIGLPKTGTTAIQETLQRQFDEKKLDKFGMQFFHDEVRRSVIDFRCTGDEKYFIEQIHNGITTYSNLGEKDVILSDEMIPHKSDYNEWCFNYDLFPILVKTLKNYNIKVIVYLRRQDLFIDSLVNQYIKEAHYPTYNETSLYYKELLDKCLECFGGEVIVRKYERENLYGNDAVIDFLHIVGLDELIEDYKENKGKIVNSSLPSCSLQLAMADSKQYTLNNADEIRLRLDEIENKHEKGLISRELYAFLALLCSMGHDIRRFVKGERLMRMKLLRGGDNFSLGSSSQGILSDEERDRILEQYAEDNAIVARKYFGSEDGVLFNDKRPKNIINIHAEPTTTDVVQFFMPIVTNLAQRCERLEQIIAKHFPEE